LLRQGSKGSKGWQGTNTLAYFVTKKKKFYEIDFCSEETKVFGHFHSGNLPRFQPGAKSIKLYSSPSSSLTSCA
jgi:hypothetical protein